MKATKEYGEQYDDAEAIAYQERKPGKHAAELRLIDRAFASIPKAHRVLDIPCGGGRVMLHLASRGYRVAGADISEGMLKVARAQASRAGRDCPIELQDVEHLTYPDRHFDTIVCFRLFHHFPTPEIRRRAVSELCRVAASNVVLSYFNPHSLSAMYFNLRRGNSRPGRAPKYATSLAELTGYFHAAGFRLRADFAQLRYIHSLHLAVWERVKGD